ncbi:MAG: helix-turn-helix domain-containing protein, partial [Clostridia bacterium]
MDIDSVFDEYGQLFVVCEDEFLTQYGMPRRSGRYPWGSGEEPHQNTGNFASRVKELRSQGMNDKDVAVAVGCKNTSDLRAQYSRSVNEMRADRVATAHSLKSDGLSNAEVARKMNINESTLRSLLNETSEAKMNAAQRTADQLRKLVDEKGMIDIGIGVEREMNISREKMSQVLRILEDEGYVWYGGGVPQVTNPGKQTNIKVLCSPGTEHREIYDFDKVSTVKDYVQRYDENGQEVIERKFEYPASMDSSRLMIRYRDDVAPDGHTGVEKDGTVEIRRGVKDLDLGERRYAQVRIMVDNDQYIKGMAFYSDNMPDGVDVVFNTNKTPDQAGKVLKAIKTDDPNNPFGSLLREEGGQYKYTDADGQRKLGLINKTRQEGDWGEWADALPSQFLSKQSMTLIHKQLDLAKQDKQLEFDDIQALTNPTVKKALLESFANDCDAAAVHLKAAALPRQKYQVVLPIATMKDNEVYAPRYEDGE